MMSLFKRRPEVVLGFVTLLWGSTFIITKDVVRGLAPLPYLSLRFGAATLFLFALAPRALRPSRRLLRDGALLGVLQGAGLALQVSGQVYTTASKTAFITAFATALTPLCGFAMYRDRPNRIQLAGALLATVGLVLLTFPIAEAGALREWNFGDLLALACAGVYAVVIVETARRAAGADIGALVAIQTGAAALLFFALLGLAHGAIAWVPPDRWPLLLQLEARGLPIGDGGITGKLIAQVSYMALVCTVLTFTLQTWAMARMNATHAAVVFSLEPVFATGLAIAVEGSSEWPGPRGAAGAALVLVGVISSELRRATRSEA